MALNFWKPLENCGPRPEMKLVELSQAEKLACYRILKRLLANPCLLQENQWAEESIPYSKRKCRLVYGKRSCKISILDEKGNVEQSGEASALFIYLSWREGGQKEVPSLPNIQRVQNELRFLGVLGANVDACFSLARRELLREPSYSRRNNLKLQIICDEVILDFHSGPVQNEVTVIYDDQKSTAVSHVALWEKGACTLEIRSA